MFGSPGGDLRRASARNFQRERSQVCHRFRRHCQARKGAPWPWIQWIAGVKQFFDVPDTQGKVSNNEREELVRELRRELGLGGGGGGGRGKSLQVAWEL